MRSDNINALDYFVGGVPAVILFKMSFDDIKALVRSSEKTSEGYSLNVVGGGGKS